VVLDGDRRRGRRRDGGLGRRGAHRRQRSAAGAVEPGVGRERDERQAEELPRTTSARRRATRFTAEASCQSARPGA
jgi:hypothetical protein